MVFIDTTQTETKHQIATKYYFVEIEVVPDIVSDADIESKKEFKTVTVLLQVLTDGLSSIEDADTEEHRSLVSSLIPYYHFFDDLSHPVTMESIHAGKLQVLMFNDQTGLYQLERYETVFSIINRFKTFSE